MLSSISPPATSILKTASPHCPADIQLALSLPPAPFARSTGYSALLLLASVPYLWFDRFSKHCFSTCHMSGIALEDINPESEGDHPQGLPSLAGGGEGETGSQRAAHTPC